MLRTHMLTYGLSWLSWSAILPVHKDGGKEEKLKEEKKKEKNKKCGSSVRCYFVRMESGWERDHPYHLSGHTIEQARRLFMHIHNAPTVAKYQCYPKR